MDARRLFLAQHSAVHSMAVGDNASSVSEQAFRAADDGAFGRLTEMLVKVFTGRPRAMLLSGMAIIHPARHLGEVTTIRGLGGFGNGI